MTISIKFCGLSTVEAVELAASLGAWKAGFIFFEKSPRHVSLDTASSLAALARTLGLETVAVTVNPNDASLDRIIDAMKPDWIQLHGSESAARVTEIRSRYGLPVLKALSVRDHADLDAAKAYIGLADLVLFDAKAPAGSDLPGGNGVRFDWQLLRRDASDTDYVLSGGLAVDNVAEALNVSGARYLDVSSGIERAPGIKDPDKMRAFAVAVEAAHQARTPK